MAKSDMLTASLDQLQERTQRRSEAGPVPPLLRALLGPACGVGLEEVDRVCANPLALLGSSATTARARRAVLDVLDVLDEDRKVALYYALPRESRRALDQHAAFGVAVARVRDAMDEA